MTLIILRASLSLWRILNLLDGLAYIFVDIHGFRRMYSNDFTDAFLLSHNVADMFVNVFKFLDNI